jgi:hypothetical protein
MLGPPVGRHAIVAALAATCACVSLPPALEDDGGACASPGVDNDGDGYASCGVARIDCDDGDAAVHPGAREICGDQIDEDCSTGADLDCADELAGNSTSGADLWTVTNEALAITFDRGTAADGTTGPIALRSRAGSDTQLLLTSPMAMDRFWAVTSWSTIFSHRSSAAAPIFDELVTGDAVVQVRSTWADAGGNGTSTFTLFPDGRIHRHDDLTVPASGDQYLASYVSFDPAHVDHADWEGATAPEPLDIDSKVAYEEHYTGTSASFVCVFDSVTGDHVLLAAQPETGADGTRVSEANQSQVLRAGLSFDWHRGEAVVGGDYTGDVMLVVGGTGGGARPCPSKGALVTAFLRPPAIAVAPPATIAGDDADAYHEASGAYDVSAGGAAVLSLTLAAAVPSLAVHVGDVPGDHDPVVSRDGATLVRGRDYHLQHGSGDVWLVVVGGVGTGGIRVEWP